MLDVEKRIRELAKQHGSLRAAARALGIDHAYLSRLRDGIKSEPSKLTLRKLGLQKIVTYARAIAARIKLPEA